jgi:hypothetical protein
MPDCARTTVHIGCGAGFMGDRFDASLPILASMARREGPRYLMFEVLAERTLAVAQNVRRDDPSKGYSPYLEHYVRPCLAEAKRLGVTVVSNMGAANPAGGARRILEIAQEMGVPGVRVAAVLGDDLTELMPAAEIAAIETMEGIGLDGRAVLAANVYLGARPVAEAVATGADGAARVRVVRQPRRLGWVGNSNFLLDAAQAEGEYAFFAFHDDPVQPTYVERLAEALDRHPRAVLAFSDILSRGATESYVELDGISDRQERARRVLRMQGPWWIPNRGLFRLQAARAVGGMRRHLAGEYKADWPWLVALAMRGEFVRVPEPLIQKVWRDGSLSAVWNRRLRLWPSAAVVLACAREVRRAGAPLGETLVLYGELGRFASGTLRSVLIDGHPRRERRAGRAAATADATRGSIAPHRTRDCDPAG